ncbi:MAG TPA: DMT family transporter [Paucimonas sp.]|nr:DMT family transporter [Paucimonas sp.]
MSLSRKDWILLILLTLCWGVNWPIMKLGVLAFPPLSFRTLSMLLGLPTLWLAARLLRTPLAIPAGGAPAVVRLAIPNMVLWHMLMILGLSMLPSGRAVILGYTMPAWAVLGGLVFFGERIGKTAWLGVGCAVGGALLLLSGEFSAISGRPLGSLLVLVAAACWGYGTVAMKRTPIEIPTVALTFWMLTLTTVVMGAASWLFERDAWRLPDAVEWSAIVYNAVVIFGFAHAAWFRLARTLPPFASSLSIMMIPVVGVFCGAWLLGETPHWRDYGAMLLILAAMSIVLLKPGSPGRT